MASSFVNIGYPNPAHSSQISFICEITCLFTFCQHSINFKESPWKCVMLVIKNVYVKILLHAHIQARMAPLVGNYLFRRNNFGLNDFPLLHSGFWPNICRRSLWKEELPIPSNFHVSYSVSIPCFNINGSEWGLKIQSTKSKSTKVYTWCNFNNICRT